MEIADTYACCLCAVFEELCRNLKGVAYPSPRSIPALVKA